MHDPATPKWILEEAIDRDRLQNRRGKTSYTGWVKEMYDNGQKRRETNYHEGEQHGLDTVWDKEGNTKHQTDFLPDNRSP